MVKLVLVSFDIDYTAAPKGSYARTYDVLEAFGMKGTALNALKGDVELPTTTVIGEVTMGDAATAKSIREQLLDELAKVGVPVTHIVVAFLEDFAGHGKPVAA